MPQKHLRALESKALAEAVRAHDREIAAQERATEALGAAVEAGVPVPQLVKATGIPRMTLLRRLGKAPTAATPQTNQVAPATVERPGA